MPALQREAVWAEERLSGDLWQSVPQNGYVRLHIMEKKMEKCWFGLPQNSERKKITEKLEYPPLDPILELFFLFRSYFS